MTLGAAAFVPLSAYPPSDPDALDRRRGEAALKKAIEQVCPADGSAELAAGSLLALRSSRVAEPHRRAPSSSLAVVCVVSGRSVVNVAGASATVAAGQYAIREDDPGIELVEPFSGAPFVGVVLEMSASTMAEVLVGGDPKDAPEDMSSRGPASAPGVYDLTPGIADAFRRLIDAQADGSERRVLGALFLKEIAFRLYRRHPDLVRGKALYERQAKKVTAAIKIMQAELHRPIRISHIAERVGASTSSLAHGFKSVMGVSPHQFLRRMRLERARVMIVGEGLRVSEAALRIGYASSSHFVEEFKRQFGECPSEYLRQFRRRQEREIDLDPTGSGRSEHQDPETT
ncbi:AraC-like DNA-binding protein [Panacagrimonas perspica]|uniref:AraC-like DNA-binding protein n=1 Tax=Panacagrimonas perspica TaxID=381431 RepID=A0A4S3K2Q5_9GAMM|nr:AraC family transcriptional regulator [Panacagrimonas perspica]TDU28878.1 AraC-like DNA-binding protein [Panacagrimonas perspica]THD02295.1 hypothetical protein B1810_15315 [Panacagrimonas perspica]